MRSHNQMVILFLGHRRDQLIIFDLFTVVSKRYKFNKKFESKTRLFEIK